MRWNCIEGIGHISQSVNLGQPVGVYFGCELPIARPRGPEEVATNDCNRSNNLATQGCRWN